jgi:hypothetical protein
MAQESCLDCYRKHIATAMVFEDEAAICGAYPLHKWLAVGELNAAAKEVQKEFPILANMTREHCLAYQNDGIAIPTCELLQIACELEKDLEKEEELSFAEKVVDLNNNEDRE